MSVWGGLHPPHRLAQSKLIGLPQFRPNIGIPSSQGPLDRAGKHSSQPPSQPAPSQLPMFRSSLLVSLLAALGAVMSFLNQLVLARFFGTTAEMDAYLIAISLPLTISGLLAGVLGYQLVPALRRAEASRGGADALFRSACLGLGGGAAFFAVVGAIGSAWLVRKLNPGLSLEQQVLISRLAHVTWLCLPFAVLGTIYTAGLHNRQRFAAATLMTFAPTIGSIVVCLLAHARIGIDAAVWGQFLGYVAVPVGLRLALGKPGRGRDPSGFRNVLAQMPLALTAMLIFVLYPFSDAIWGSRVGLSAVSYLGYAQRLLVGFSGLAVVGATTVLFPRLARHAALGEHEALRRDLGLSLRYMLVCMAPAATLIWVLADPALQLLFQRGAFHLSDTLALGGLLRPMLFGMVAMSCMGLVFKALFANGQVGFAAIFSTVGSGVYFALSGFLGTRMGVLGIGYAYAITWWLVFVLSLTFIWRHLPIRRFLFSAVAFLAKLSAATASVAVVACLGSQFLPAASSGDSPRRLLVLAGTATVAIGTYLALGNGPLASYEVRLIIQHLSSIAKPATPEDGT